MEGKDTLLISLPSRLQDDYKVATVEWLLLLISQFADRSSAATLGWHLTADKIPLCHQEGPCLAFLF